MVVMWPWQEFQTFHEPSHGSIYPQHCFVRTVAVEKPCQLSMKCIDFKDFLVIQASGSSRGSWSCVYFVCNRGVRKEAHCRFVWSVTSRRTSALRFEWKLWNLLSTFSLEPHQWWKQTTNKVGKILRLVFHFVS